MAKLHGMAQEKNVRRRGGWVEHGALEGKNLAGRAILAGSLEALRTSRMGWVQGKSDDRITRDGRLLRKSEVGDAKSARERIRFSAKNSDVASAIRGDDLYLQQLRRTFAPVDQDVWLTAIAKSFEDVGVGEQIALVIDEEGVSKELVMISARGRGLVELVDNGANGAALGRVDFSRNRAGRGARGLEHSAGA